MSPMPLRERNTRIPSEKAVARIDMTKTIRAMATRSSVIVKPVRRRMTVLLFLAELLNTETQRHRENQIWIRSSGETPVRPIRRLVFFTYFSLLCASVPLCLKILRFHAAELLNTETQRHRENQIWIRSCG